MQFTRASDYAARVLSHLANQNSSVSQAHLIAAATGVPESFLSKILGQLSRAGLVRSHRGARGGFSLAADPRNLTLLDVIEAIEGPVQLNLCSGPEPCSFSGRCPIEKAFVKAEEALCDSLRSFRIAELAAACREIELFSCQGAR